MTYYLLKTKHHPFSPVFADMVTMFQLGETVIEEGYDTSADYLRHLGIQSIPTLIATATIDGRQVLVHECFNPAELPSFLLTAANKLAALEG